MQRDFLNHCVIFLHAIKKTKYKIISVITVLCIYFILPWTFVDCRENVILKVFTFLDMIYYLALYFTGTFFNNMRLRMHKLPCLQGHIRISV